MESGDWREVKLRGCGEREVGSVEWVVGSGEDKGVWGVESGE